MECSFLRSAVARSLFLVACASLFGSAQGAPFTSKSALSVFFSLSHARHTHHAPWATVLNYINLNSQAEARKRRRGSFTLYGFIIANTARIKAKFRRRLLGWFTVLRSLVKTPTSYFGVGFGLLVLYCDRNINKDKLRECMEGSKWTEYAKNNRSW